MRLTSVSPRKAIMAALGMLLGLHGTAPSPAVAYGQEPKSSAVGRASPSNDENIKSIDEEYARQVLALERRRLERLDRLAAQQKPAEAAATYEKLFRLAIAANLFSDAEPFAKAVLGTGSPSPIAMGLAHTVKIIAEADRGDYEQSLQSLRQAVADREAVAQAGAPRPE